jgi:hypothetical protein
MIDAGVNKTALIAIVHERLSDFEAFTSHVLRQL